MKPITVERKCETCGKTFSVREKELQWRTPKYCSPSCYDASRTGQKRKPYSSALPEKPCEYCGAMFKPRHSRSRFCSRACLYSVARGEGAPSWKGGRIKTEQGYYVIYRPQHPAAQSNGYMPEHRVVMEETLGRRLEDHETVHHINGDRGDNRPENLQLRSGRHGKGACFRCLDCGSTNVVAVQIAEA